MVDRTRRRLLLAAACAPAAGCAALDVKQSEWIFRPVRAGDAAEVPPDGVTETWLPVPGQEGRLHAWWAPAARDDAPAVLYLHGARRDLAGSWFRIQRLRDMGFAVLAIDYRGFGRSSGDLPTESQAYEDAGIAWQHLAQRVPQASRRFIYGHSLGGAIAIDLASRLEPAMAAGLITEAAFTSVPDVVAASRYGWAPVGFLITQRFETVEKMRRVRLPKLIMHGTADRVVPHTMADQLFEVAAEPRRLVKFDGAGHSLAWSSSEPYREAVRGFVQTVLAEVRSKAAAG